MPKTKKPRLLFILGGPGSGKSTLAKALLELGAYQYLTSDKDLLSSKIKIKQPLISQFLGKAQVDQDSLYEVLADEILSDSKNPDITRVVLGNFPQRFLTGILFIEDFLAKFDILIARITCTDPEIHWRRVKARFESGIQVEKDKNFMERTRFKKNLATLIEQEEQFIRQIRPYIQSEDIKYTEIDNSQVLSPQQIENKARELEAFINQYHRTIFEVTPQNSPTLDALSSSDESTSSSTPPAFLYGSFEQSNQFLDEYPVTPSYPNDRMITHQFTMRKEKEEAAYTLSSPPREKSGGNLQEPPARQSGQGFILNALMSKKEKPRADQLPPPTLYQQASDGRLNHGNRLVMRKNSS